MNPCYNSAEGAQGKTCDFEKLFPERNSNDRDAKDQAKQKVRQSQRPSAHQKPHDIQEKRDWLAFVMDFLAKRIQGDTRQLEALQTNGSVKSFL